MINSVSRKNSTKPRRRRKIAAAKVKARRRVRHAEKAAVVRGEDVGHIRGMTDRDD